MTIRCGSLVAHVPCADTQAAATMLAAAWRDHIATPSRPPPPPLAAPRGDERAFRAAVDDGASSVLGMLLAALPLLRGRVRTSISTALRTPPVRAALGAELVQQVGYLAKAADAFRHLTPQLVDLICDEVRVACEGIVPSACATVSHGLADADAGSSRASTASDAPCVGTYTYDLGAGDEYFNVITRDEGVQTDIAFHPAAEVLTGALLPLPAALCSACGANDTSKETQLAVADCVGTAAPGECAALEPCDSRAAIPTSPASTPSVESPACGTPLPPLANSCASESAARGPSVPPACSSLLGPYANNACLESHACGTLVPLLDPGSAAAAPGDLASPIGCSSLLGPSAHDDASASDSPRGSTT